MSKVCGTHLQRAFALVIGLAISASSVHAEGDRSAAARQYFSDVPLIDEQGRTKKFYSDVLEGKLLVIHAFYGDCKDVCPVTLGKLRMMQDALGERLGKDVHFVSISVNPQDDNAQRLSEIRQHFSGKAGWMFLGGKKENVDWALYKLGLHAEVKEAHNPILLIGNERAGDWKKIAAYAKVEDLIAQIEELSQGKK